jgi:hypothetical protein
MPGDEREHREAELEARLVVLDRNKALTYASAAAIVGGASLFLAFLVARFAPGLFGMQIVMFGVFLRAAQATRSLASRRTERAVRFSAGGVTAPGRTIDRRAIADGYFQPRPPPEVKQGRRRGVGSTVCLRDRFRRVLFEAEVASEDQALAILRVLGLDASRKRAEFRGAAPAAATYPRYLVSLALTTGFVVGLHVLLRTLGIGLGAFATMGGILPFILAAGLPSTIVIGVDGILLRWLWARRFIPMSEITGVTPAGERSIRIQLASGKVEMLHTSNSRRNSILSLAPHRDAVLARLLEAWSSHRERGPTADVAALVARGTRNPVEWRRALEQLASADPGYREPALRDEDLWRVVEDPRAREDARAAAAVLLRSRLDDGGRARVRIAAEASASPRLRVALDAAAAGSDDALDAALAELAQQQPGAADRHVPSARIVRPTTPQRPDVN